MVVYGKNKTNNKKKKTTRKSKVKNCPTCR